MPKVPVDAPRDKVLAGLERLGFQIERKGSHISKARQNADGSATPLTMSNHRTIKSSTRRTIVTQAGVSREDFLETYSQG